MRTLAILAILTAQAWAEDRPVLWEPPAALPCTLRDIASRLRPGALDQFGCDLVTCAHEGSHLLAKMEDDRYGLYVRSGRIVYLQNPPLRTAEVFRAIPLNKRGEIWDVYREQAQQEYFVTRPLMLCDEWVGYLRGSQVRQELRQITRQETDRYCATMAEYCNVMYQMSKRCKGYDHQPLGQFCRAILEECQQTIPNWDEMTQVTFD